MQMAPIRAAAMHARTVVVRAVRLQLFPYHLSDYLCRVLRISPFRYYHDMMAAVLKDERSYDRIPNFTVSR